ncbi:MAG: cysteine-rich CWC family protein [Anaerolineae bacterium]
MPVESQRQNGVRTCAECGSAFTCEVEAGQTQCWCFNLPRIIPLNGSNSSGCLCPACLSAKIEALQGRDEQV